MLYSSADPGFGAVRRVRESIQESQTKLVPRDVQIRVSGRRLSETASIATRARGHLCSRRCSGLSFDGVDDRRASPGGGCPGAGGGSATNGVWRATRRCWRRAMNWVLRRSIGLAVHRPLPRWPMAWRGSGKWTRSLARVICSSRWPKIRLWRSRYRLDRRTERGGGDCRRARAEFVAADLIAQAEHAPGSGILITRSHRLLNEVTDELARQLAPLERGDLARQSLQDFGALILVGDADEACLLADEIAERAFAHRRRKRRNLAGEDSPRWCSVSRRIQPCGTWRLCRRAVARFADRRHSTMGQRSFGCRLCPD